MTLTKTTDPRLLLSRDYTKEAKSFTVIKVATIPQYAATPCILRHATRRCWIVCLLGLLIAPCTSRQPMESVTSLGEAARVVTFFHANLPFPFPFFCSSLVVLLHHEILGVPGVLRIFLCFYVLEPVHTWLLQHPEPIFADSIFPYVNFLQCQCGHFEKFH